MRTNVTIGSFVPGNETSTLSFPGTKVHGNETSLYPSIHTAEQIPKKSKFEQYNSTDDGRR